MITPDDVSAYQRLMNAKPTAIAKVVFFGVFKVAAAIGQADFGMEKFLLYRELMPACDTDIAVSSDNPHESLNEVLSLITGIAAGTITGASRIPSMWQQANGGDSSSASCFSPGCMCFEDFNCRSCTSTLIGKFILGCSFTSSFFVVVSSYLFGYTLMDSFVDKYLLQTDSEALKITIASLTAAASWYSFLSYAIKRARTNGVEIGEAIIGWLNAPSLPSKEILKTTVLSLSILVSASVGNYFFVKHAIPLFPPTAYFFGEDEESPQVKAFALFSMFPSFFTSLGTRIASVHHVVKGRYDIKPPIPTSNIHKALFYSLAFIATLDLITGALGNNRSGVNIFCDVGYDLSQMEGGERFFFELFNIIVFNIPNVIQNYTFTSLQMLKDFAEWLEPGLVPMDEPDLEDPLAYFHRHDDDSSDEGELGTLSDQDDDIDGPSFARRTWQGLHSWWEGSRATTSASPLMSNATPSYNGSKYGYFKSQASDADSGYDSDPEQGLGAGAASAMRRNNSVAYF